MYWSKFLAFAILHLEYACATPTPHRALFKREDGDFTLKTVEAIKSKKDLDFTVTSFLLKEVGGITRSTSVLLESSSGDTTPLQSIESGLSYAVDVQLSDQSFSLIFDTGSSDLWVAGTGFVCVNANGRKIPEGRCDLGPLFSGNFQEGKIPKEHLYIPYGSGEAVAGYLGYEDVTVAGVTVDHQEIGVVEEAYYLGDGVTSGILGFAYSSLTSAYKGNNFGNDRKSGLMHYTNFIGNVVKQGKVNPEFSIILDRSGSGSELVLGGLPSGNHDYTSTPLLIYEYSPRAPIEARQYTYYTIEIGGFLVSGKTIGSNLHVVVDSGTTIAYVPANLAREINAAFSPPAKLVSGFWEVSCGATPPSFAVSIGGTKFKISPAELLPPKALSYDPNTGLCLTGFQPSPRGTPPILGGTFLKNVVAVFDIGAAEMRFAPQ